MWLTRQAEIAIDILVLCARRHASDSVVTTRDAAAQARTTKDHAAQVVMRLVKAGYLHSERGRSGGIRLARSAARINVGDVLRLIDPAINALTDGAEPGLPASRPFDEVRRVATVAYLAIFDSFTVADIAGDQSSGQLNCLDCSLHTVIRHGRALAGFRQGRTVPVTM